MPTDEPRPSARRERDAALVHVLHRLWTYSLTTKSDEVRSYADEVAEAASRQLITTAIVPNGSLYGRLWKLTPAGTSFLFDNAALVADEETKYVEHHLQS